MRPALFVEVANGRDVAVDTSKVAYIVDQGSDTLIVFDGGARLAVRSSFREVLAELED